VRVRRLHAIGVCTIASLLFGNAHADPWLEPGDAAQRADIQLLADAGILRGPVTTWPISWPDIARDALSADERGLDAASALALLRVQRRSRAASVRGFTGAGIRIGAAYDPSMLREFADTPREEGEVAARAGWLSDHFAVNLQGSYVFDPDDGKKWRADGSYLGVNFGNYMLSVGFMERWWGPGWDSSLILSTNARPIPTLTLERNYTDPFQTRWLSWIGPWRASIAMGRAESEGVPVTDVRFFAARVNFKPRPWLEFGLTRTAQWCGEDRPCDLGTFWDLLVGNDTRTVTTTLEDEPGNQLAGADLRWTGGPHGRRYAVYGQLIGEDVTSGTSPAKFTGRFGFERWGYFEQWHASYRWSLEGANTAANFLGEPKYNYSYEHFIYFDGYRYRGRAIGDSLDNDGRIGALQGMLISEHDRTWTALLQFAQINRDDTEKAPGTQTVSATAADLWNFEVGHGRPLGRGTLSLGLGFERFEHKDSGDTEDSPRFMLQWESTQ